MSSAFAMVLMAAMAVPANGPEKVSGEVAEPQRLDLNGDWMGHCWVTGDKPAKCWFGQEKVGEGFLLLQENVVDYDQRVIHLLLHAVDEGGGRCRDRNGPCLAIYEQHDNEVKLCIRDPGKGRPTSFRAGDGQTLFILHRIKPRK